MAMLTFKRQLLRNVINTQYVSPHLAVLVPVRNRPGLSYSHYFHFQTLE